MSLFDVDLDTIDTDVIKLKYNASPATAYKGYDMVKIRAKRAGYFTSYHIMQYFIVFNIKENTIYIIRIIGNTVREKEMKFNNLTAFDIDCIIKQYTNKLIEATAQRDPDGQYSIEYY